MSLSVDADISANTDLLGKHASDLQEGIVVSGGVINGTLKYVTGYTGFSGSPDEQEGNFLAVHAAAEGATSIGWRPLGSTADPVVLDEDGLLILKVGPNAKGFEYVTVKDGVTYVNVMSYNLTKEVEA